MISKVLTTFLAFFIFSASFSLAPEKPHTNVVPFDKLAQAMQADITKSPYYVELITQLTDFDNCAELSFEIPETWKNREIFIVFEGMEMNLSLMLNYQAVDTTDEKLNLQEWKITRLIKTGTNTLLLRSLNKRSTIFQAYIYATPKLQIRDYKISNNLDASLTNGEIQIEGEVRNLDKRDYYKYSIEFALYDAKGKKVFSEQSPAFSFGKSKNKTKGINYNKSIPNVQRWTLAKPYLYTLVINMRDGDDNSELEILSKKIAFRKVEIFDSLLILNGIERPLNYAGLTLADIKLSKDSIIQKITFLKKNNINMVLSPSYLPAAWQEKCLSGGLVAYCDTGSTFLKQNASRFEALAIDWTDTSKNTVLIRNLNIEADEENIVAAWNVKKGIRVVQSGVIKIDFPIGKEKIFQLPQNVTSNKDLENCMLTLSARSISTTARYQKDHVVLDKKLDFKKP